MNKSPQNILPRARTEFVRITDAHLDKVFSLDSLRLEIATQRVMQILDAPKIYGLVSGGFDPLNADDVLFLQMARKQCDFMIVTITPDKDCVPPTRAPEQIRVKNVAAFDCVDAAVVACGSLATQMIKPDIVFMNDSEKPQSLMPPAP